MTRIMHNPQGVDVSDNNGDFDWHAWNGHIDFAMMKASEGPIPNFPNGYHDTQFENNWESAHALGLFRFAYHYAHPGTSDPDQQARFFVDIVKDAWLGPHDNFALDLEVSDGLTPAQVSFWADVFCREVNRLTRDHRCMVYTFPSFGDVGNCAALGDRPLWIANYDTPLPHVPPPWRTWAFWQYLGSGTDRDVFNGSLKDLEKFCLH